MWDTLTGIKNRNMAKCFRNRAEHLELFLFHMHPVLQRQQLDYQIFVIEQAGEGAFNRAILMNIGYAEAMKVGNFSCFVFHDVDLVPEDDRYEYTFPVKWNLLILFRVFSGTSTLAPRTGPSTWRYQ